MKYVILLTLLVFSVNSFADTPIKKLHRELAGVPSSDGWYKAKSTEGNYSVVLPNVFNDFTLENKTNTNEKYFGLAARSKNGCAFISTLVTKNLDMENKFTQDYKSAEGSTSIGKYKGAPFLNGEGVNSSGYYFIGRRVKSDKGIFMLMITCPSSEKSYAKKSAEKFFNSLSW